MKLPKSAKLVHKGIIFDIYQWPQKMFDGSIETFEMIKRADTVQIIATEGDQILIAEEEQPAIKRFHTLFGGRQDENETPLECAQRELLEESGYSSDDWELIKTYEPYCKADWTIYLFTARNCQKTTEQKLDAGEKITVKKVSWEKFLKTVTDERFTGKDFALDVLRMRASGTLEALKEKIFGK